MTAASPSFWSRVPGWWKRLWTLPFASTFAIVLLLQVVGEQFPFSPFPMYAKFSDETNVLFVTDAADRPLAIAKYFRLSASKIKKSFNAELESICKKKGYPATSATDEDLRQAGQYIAATFLPTQLRQNPPSDIRKHGLKLKRTVLWMDKKGFHEETAVVGELKS
ncbi:MAG TPA: hypothetical protein VIT91_06180 [Chthoniobacterales bacterium]